jgi:hypothetical protein
MGQRELLKLLLTGATLSGASSKSKYLHPLCGPAARLKAAAAHCLSLLRSTMLMAMENS